MQRSKIKRQSWRFPEKKKGMSLRCWKDYYRITAMVVFPFAVCNGTMLEFEL